MSTALVTGGAGFIGAAVVRVLEAAGHAVTIAGTGVTRDPLTRDRIAALAPAQLVVHCAGSSSVAASIADPDAELAKTVPAFAQLLDAIAAWPDVRVVFVSSAAVYGNAAIVPTPETCAVAPVSPYGVHKRACEELCERSGIASVIVRLFSVYGPGLRKQLLWDACTKARAGRATFAGTGDEQRDWLHVTDAAALVLAAAAHAAPGAAVVNGGSGIGVPVREVVTQICRAFDVSPVFTGDARAGDPPRYVADITRARALGWAPRVELARGLAEYVAWFVEHG